MEQKQQNNKDIDAIAEEWVNNNFGADLFQSIDKAWFIRMLSKFAAQQNEVINDLASALEMLIFCKTYEDSYGKYDGVYRKVSPAAWEEAKSAIEKYNNQKNKLMEQKRTFEEILSSDYHVILEDNRRDESMKLAAEKYATQFISEQKPSWKIALEQKRWKDKFTDFVTNEGRHSYIDKTVAKLIIEYIESKIFPLYTSEQNPSAGVWVKATNNEIRKAFKSTHNHSKPYGTTDGYINTLKSNLREQGLFITKFDESEQKPSAGVFYCWHNDATGEDKCTPQCELCKRIKSDEPQSEKPLTDAEIESLAEKETYVDIANDFDLRIMKEAFIKGYKTSH